MNSPGALPPISPFPFSPGMPGGILALQTFQSQRYSISEPKYRLACDMGRYVVSMAMNLLLRLPPNRRNSPGRELTLRA